MYRGRLVPGNFFDDAEDGAISRKRWSSQPCETEPLQRSGGACRVGEKRIACVLVADFAVAAITRTNPELRDRPFALIRMPTSRSPKSNSSKPAAYQPHSELSHVSPTARAAGLRPTMTVA